LSRRVSLEVRVDAAEEQGLRATALVARGFGFV
jgi:hypothetical protein